MGHTIANRDKDVVETQAEVPSYANEIDDYMSEHDLNMILMTIKVWMERRWQLDSQEDVFSLTLISAKLVSINVKTYLRVTQVNAS